VISRRAWLALIGTGLGVGLAAGCGSPSAPADGPRLTVATVPLSTSLVTAQGAWAVLVMGRSAGGHNNFWQLFFQPTGATQWSLVTPEGVADNGGLVAAGGATGTSLLVGFRPSQGLSFSPLAASSDAGKTWTPGLLDARLADVPGALAISASGQALALLHDGSIEEAPTAAAATAGHWSRLTTLGGLAASAPGRACGLAGVEAVSVGVGDTPLAAGSCAKRGVSGVFAETGGTWQAAGPVLPAAFGGDQVQVLGLASAPDGTAALIAAGASLVAAWSNGIGGSGWMVSAPLAAPAGTLKASGFGPGGSVWVLLAGGRAEVIRGTGGAWQALPDVPAGTQVLARVAGGGWEALAASGSNFSVWQLGKAPATGGSWVRGQLIVVPIEYGSSG
jgi:hypothetical protein